MKVNESELVLFTRKIIRGYFPNAYDASKKIDSKMVLVAIYLHEDSLKLSNGLTDIKYLWQWTFMPAKSAIITITKLAIGLTLYSRDKIAPRIKANINGKVKLLVKNKTRANLRSVFETYYLTGEIHPYDGISKILKIKNKSSSGLSKGVGKLGAYTLGKAIGSILNK